MSNQSISWNRIREQFPILQQKVYLNAAGMTPIPRAVYEAGHTALSTMLGDVRSFATSYMANLHAARAAVAGFYHTDPSAMAFVHTTSLGMNMLGLLLRKRRPKQHHVVTLSDEFASSSWPWQQQGFDVTFVDAEPDSTYNVDRILAAVNDSTTAVVASYVQYGTGARVDVETLAHALKDRGVELILNATQAAGVIPIDLSSLPVSAMLVSGNKWMMSGPGTAVLYLAPHLRDDEFPPMAGWMSAENLRHDNKGLAALKRDASALEVGLNSLIPIMCLKAAVEFVDQIGVDHIYQRVLGLGDELIGMLEETGADIITPLAESARCGIISVRRQGAQAWAKAAEERGVVVVLRGADIIRISPHMYNTTEDLQALMSLW